MNLRLRAAHITPAKKNQFVSQGGNSDELGVYPEVNEGFGQVYLLFNQAGALFGQDGVRFDIQNKENLGISGIYYETLSTQASNRIKELSSNPATSQNQPQDLNLAQIEIQKKVILKTTQN